MKKFVSFVALVAISLSLFAQDDCVSVATSNKGSVTITFKRYKHKEMTGIFTINELGTQVRFSQGNLQYRASTNTWRFAEEQYDMIGNANSSISDANDNWIDLFGYGTSGASSVNGGSAVAWQPWSTSTTDADYAPGGNNAANLNGSFADADWAYYNPIVNGGGEGGPASHQWRLLTQDEWDYIFRTRTNAASLFGHGTLMGVQGVYLLPDGWDWSESELATAATAYGSFVFSSGVVAYAANTIGNSAAGIALWEAMENAGAVFLPAAGRREGTSVGAAGYGLYWSSTHQGTAKGYIVRFGNSLLQTPKTDSEQSNVKLSRHFGVAVRPIQELRTE